MINKIIKLKKYEDNPFYRYGNLGTISSLNVIHQLKVVSIQIEKEITYLICEDYKGDYLKIKKDSQYEIVEKSKEIYSLWAYSYWEQIFSDSHRRHYESGIYFNGNKFHAFEGHTNDYLMSKMEKFGLNDQHKLDIEELVKINKFRKY